MIRRHPVACATSALVIALLWIPLVIVCVNALNRDELLVSWQGATTRWFGQAWNDGIVRDSLLVSLRIALVSTAVSLVIATTAVLFWRGALPRARRILDASTVLRIAMPEVVFATGLLLLFARIGIPFGTPTVALGHAVFGSAYATVVLQARLRALDPALEEAAGDLGASPFRRAWRVTLPLLAPGLLAAGGLAFILSLDDVITTQLLGDPRENTLPLVILGIVRRTVTPEANAIGAIVLALSIVVTTFVILASGQRSRRA